MLWILIVVAVVSFSILIWSLCEIAQYADEKATSFDFEVGF